MLALCDQAAAFLQALKSADRCQLYDDVSQGCGLHRSRHNRNPAAVGRQLAENLRLDASAQHMQHGEGSAGCTGQLLQRKTVFQRKTLIDAPDVYKRQLLERKVEKAKILLMNPDMKVSEIADLLDFSDESHFSKVFKRLTGISPKQYRINHR